MTARESWRRFGLGLATLTGWRRRGWFIPYRYADSLAPPGGAPPYEAVERLFAARRDAFITVLDRIDSWWDALQAIAAGATAAPSPPPAGRLPRFDQAWFPTLDACAAYALVRALAPRRIVEVGAGHSTRFLARALQDAGAGGRIVAIDPAPRADIAALPAVEVVRDTVHRAAREPFAALAAGDMLVIDSSHILMPGSDVDLLFNHVLPALPAGTIVHIHDVLLPDDYPARWAWRNYNEQLAVAPLLTGGGYEPLFASHYVRTRLAERMAASVVMSLPRHPQAFPTSLWLRKMTGGPA